MTEERFFTVLGLATWARSPQQKERYFQETTREERKIVNFWFSARAAYDLAKENQKLSEKYAKTNAFTLQQKHGRLATEAWQKGNETWRKFKAAIDEDR